MILQVEKKGFTASVDLDRAFKKDEVKKLDQAVTFLVKGFTSDQFQEYVMNYAYTVTRYKYIGLKKYTWKETYKGFWENKGLSQAEIYDLIYSGSELLDKEKDNEADFYLKVDRSYKPNVLAYTYRSKKEIYLYANTLKEKDHRFIAGTLLHEYCHKVGFSHVSGKRKRHTVPYGCGRGLRQVEL